MIKTPDPLRTQALARPDNPAIVLADRSISYGELHGTVNQLAAAFSAEGIDDGDRVALHALAPWETIMAILALWRAGAVACPLSSRYTDNQVQSYSRMIGATHVISVLPPIAHVVAAPASADWYLDRDATILMTSGSTGVSKAVIHSFGAHYYSASGSAQNIPIGPGDRWLLALPLYHVGGLAIVIRCLVAGATIDVAPDGQPLNEVVQAMKPTHLSLVPTQLHRLLRSGSAAMLSRMRAILVGGGPLDAALAEHAAREELPVATSYGLTEMASQVCTTNVGARDRWHTAGKVLLYREVDLSDDGEILVRGETLCRRILAATGPVMFDSGGWYHTGDMGRFDENGDLVVFGRRDSMFISGGENIHPEQIESALLQIDGVQQAVIVPVPDREFGARPAAFIRADSDALLDLARVHRALEDLGMIERFKLPVAVWALPEEYSRSMKPDRSALSKLACKLQTHQSRG